MTYTYGEFTPNQIAETKQMMRKQIFFLLLIVDPETSDQYEVSVYDAFKNVLTVFGSLNDLLRYPSEFVKVMALINAAFLEYKSQDFSFRRYRKLILDAGNEVLKIKEV